MLVTVKKSLNGKFGPSLMLDDGSYLSFSKFFKGATEFQPGTQLEVDLYTSPKGKQYANAVTVIGAGSDAGVHGDVPTIPPEMIGTGTPVNKPRDFDKEARGKTACALLQALYSNPTVDLKDVHALSRLVEWGVMEVFGENS